MPQIEQNQCFEVWVWKVYSFSLFLPLITSKFLRSTQAKTGYFLLHIEQEHLCTCSIPFGSVRFISTAPQWQVNNAEFSILNGTPRILRVNFTPWVYEGSTNYSSFLLQPQLLYDFIHCAPYKANMLWPYNWLRPAYEKNWINTICVSKLTALGRRFLPPLYWRLNVNRYHFDLRIPRRSHSFSWREKGMSFHLKLRENIVLWMDCNAYATITKY